jgi:hypothetical protein
MNSKKDVLDVLDKHKAAISFLYDSTCQSERSQQRALDMFAQKAYKSPCKTLAPVVGTFYRQQPKTQ